MTTKNSNSERVTTSVFNYLPTRFKGDNADWAVRKLVWSFKDGEKNAQIKAVKVISKTIQDTFGSVKDVVFACIPASSQEKTNIRYAAFSNEICANLGTINAFSFVKVEGERLAVHEFKTQKKIENTSVVKFNKKFFAGKKVIVFDDIITKGTSFNLFADSLQNLGADVLGGVFLAKTIILKRGASK